MHSSHLPSNIRNLTDQELVREYQYSDDPLIAELAHRLGTSADVADLETELEELQEDYENLESEKDVERANALEDQADEYEEKFDHLEERLAHEVQRVGEFYNENQQFIAEIKNLKERNSKMLETQIEELGERMGAVEAKMDRNNELLEKILEAVSGQTPPAPAAEKAAPETAKPKRTKTKPKLVEKSEPAEEPVEELTLDIVRDAFLEAQEATNKKTALGALRRIAGAKIRNFPEVPSEKYADLMAAFKGLVAEANSKEAA